MSDSTNRPASGDSLVMRPLTTQDIDFLMQLVGEAGWNQTARDLRRIVEHQPEGCFLASWDGRPAGAVTTTCYRRRAAWIGMMLVRADMRRRGIATALMRRCLDFLQQRQVDTIKLDASADGHPVYRKLGFEDQWPVRRWRRETAGDGGGSEIAAGGALGSDSVRLDRVCFGADRSHWLKKLAADSLTAEAPDGFAMLRSGRVAAYLGPVVAARQTTARGLVEQLLERAAGPVLWDIPGPNTEAESLAAELGFQPVRQLTRMKIGAPCEGELRLHYGAADFATG